MEKAKRWFIGIDWASREHEVCALDEAGEVVGRRAVPHSGDGLAALCDWLLELTGSAPEHVHVGIEVPRGAIVDTLLERGFPVYAINPKQLDRFRDRFTTAGAKDDRLDARVLADSLRTDARSYRKLVVDHPRVIELREHSRLYSELQKERSQFANRIREQLRRYYPQMLELGVEVGVEWFLALWELVPTPAKAKRVREVDVERVLRKYRVRKTDTASVLQVLRQRPLTVAPGTTEAATAHISSLVARLRLVLEQMKHTEKRIDQLFVALADEQETTPGQKGEQRDAEILRSLPGVGRIVLATLLAEASQPLAARDYSTLRALCGVAPVTRRTGQGRRPTMAMRKACNPRLRDAVYHWGRVAIQHDPNVRARYSALRSRGCSHGRALRTIGDRMLGVACAMLRNQEPFERGRTTRQAA